MRTTDEGVPGSSGPQASVYLKTGLHLKVLHYIALFSYFPVLEFLPFGIIYV